MSLSGGSHPYHPLGSEAPHHGSTEALQDTKRVTLEVLMDTAGMDVNWLLALLRDHASTGGSQKDWYVTLSEYEPLGARLSCAVFSVHDGDCNTSYLLTLMNHEPQYEEVIEQMCEAGNDDTRLVSIEYRKTGPGQFTVIKSIERVSAPEALDSLGKVKPGYNIFNSPTRIDSTVRQLRVSSGGVILKS